MRIFRHALWLGCALASGAYGASPSVGIPFDYAEGLLWVQVESPQSARRLNFLFDTGAELSVINAGTVSELGLRAGKTIRVQGVQAVTTGHWPVSLTAKAGGMALPAQYLALDLSALAHSCQRPLDGLIGADFLQGKVVEIDFQAHRICFREPPAPAPLDVVLPLKISGKCFCVPVRINQAPTQWVRLDTGCATPVQWVTAEVAAPAAAAIPAIGLSGLAIPQTQTTVALGAQQFEQVPTGLHRRAIFADESGLLGTGLLNRFQTVTIDTQTKRVILRPR